MAGDKKKQRVVLVVDADADFLEKLQTEQHLTDLRTYCTSTAEAAHEVLLDPGLGVVGTFVDAALPDLGWISVVESAHRNVPGTPIFLVRDSTLDVSDEELRAVGVRQSLGKPLDFKRMIDLVAPLAVDFDIDGALGKAKENTDDLGGISAAADGAFSPIRADNFLSGSKSIFDLYIRLGPGHNLKILQSGDAFDSERLLSYLNKGITHFFIKKEVQETYLRYCEHLTTRLLTSKAIPAAVKVAQTLNHGEEVMNFLKDNGLSDFQFRYASQFVFNVNQLFQQFNPAKNNVLNAFLNDVAAYDHGVGATMIASLLAEALNVTSGYAIQIVGMAALLHDIGLAKASELAHEDEALMSKPQLAVYYKHPEVGAELLAKIKAMDPAVPHAVASHHARRNNRGFPKNLGATSINQIAEIVGVSEEFSRIITKKVKSPELAPLEIMDQQMLEGFSRPVAEAFRKVFISPKP
ncbi:MAG: HDIG domain-containing protein [Deltaproteobacteria bacterium]|nr:HDIG domain-containing protein [Deltaproteobacteria bacterium]